jgi:phosphoribosyl 1,2-cyclic phosphate phosphodiesterase
MKIIFLGTGANGGIPQQDCQCKNCNLVRNNPRLKKLRSSIAIAINRKFLILDCGPDFRQQLLERNILFKDIVAIAITHLHFDHAFGLPELSVGKSFKIPIIVHPKLRKTLINNPNFNFLFKQKFAVISTTNKLDNTKISFIKVNHDLKFPTYGIIVEQANRKICYLPDVAEIDKKILKKLSESNLIIFDGTFFNKSQKGHLAIKKSAPLLEQTGKPVIFTHLNHSENQKKIKKFLEEYSFRLAKDGEEINL